MLSTKFLNIDLDLRAESGLQELLEAFGSAVIDLKREEKDCASIEIAEETQSMDETILAFCNLVRALPPRARTIWDQCEMRSMNIGFQAGTTPYLESFCLSDKIISLLSSMNVEVVITIYAAEKETVDNPLGQR